MRRLCFSEWNQRLVEHIGAEHTKMGGGARVGGGGGRGEARVGRGGGGGGVNDDEVGGNVFPC